MNTKAQEFSNWGFIVGLILGLIAIIFLVWLAVKSGQTGAQQVLGLP